MKNFIHFDFKGALPDTAGFCKLLEYFKKCSFDGVVLEYDDRIPWETWPGTWRKGYSLNELKQILTHAAKLQLEVIPLIQIQGHLEWLLKHDAYRHLREMPEVGSEICPQHEEIETTWKKWIDEAAELHPGCRYIHLGGDETWYAGLCPKCSAVGKMQVYIEHASRMCHYALSKNLRPMLWADMFWRENCMDLAAQLPEGTVLIDWQYDGIPPFNSTLKLLKTKHQIMGSTGITTGYWEHCMRLAGNFQERFNNISGWKLWAEQNDISLIHTIWARGASLWGMYGLYFSAIPGMIAAGSLERWEKHPWKNFMDNLSPVMRNNAFAELEQAAKDILHLPVADDMEKSAQQWLHLVLRYQALTSELAIHRSTKIMLDEVQKFVGKDESMLSKHTIRPFIELRKKATLWEEDARKFWKQEKLSDEKEFMATHIQLIKNEINQLLS